MSRKEKNMLLKSYRAAIDYIESILPKEEPKEVYYVHHGAKIRYIDPLFNGKRISECCKVANKLIETNLAYDMNNYVYLDFTFNDYCD